MVLAVAGLLALGLGAWVLPQRRVVRGNARGAIRGAPRGALFLCSHRGVLSDGDTDSAWGVLGRIRAGPQRCFDLDISSDGPDRPMRIGHPDLWAAPTPGPGRTVEDLPRLEELLEAVASRPVSVTLEIKPSLGPNAAERVAAAIRASPPAAHSRVLILAHGPEEVPELRAAGLRVAVGLFDRERNRTPLGNAICAGAVDPNTTALLADVDTWMPSVKYVAGCGDGFWRVLHVVVAGPRAGRSVALRLWIVDDAADACEALSAAARHGWRVLPAAHPDAAPRRPTLPDLPVSFITNRLLNVSRAVDAIPWAACVGG